MTDKHTGNRPAPGSGAQDPDVALGDNHRAGKPTGAGGEATEGIHGADGDRDPGDRTALEGKTTGRGDGELGADRAGSEPTTSHDREHKSNYGGGGANGGANGGAGNS